MIANTLAPTASAETAQVIAIEAPALALTPVSSIEQVARSRLLTVGINAFLAEVSAMLARTQISLVIVCDDAGRAVGVITETILVRQLGFGQADVFSTRAGDVMTHAFPTCSPEDSLPEVLAMMHERGLIHVPVLDADHHPVGVINARDGLRALLAMGNQEEALLRNYVMGVGYQ